MERAGDHWIANAAPGEAVSVTLLLRAPADLSERLLSGQYQAGSREQAEQAIAADPQDLTAIRAFAQQQGLKVLSEDAASRRVELQGSAENMQKAFGVQLGRAEDAAGHQFRSYQGAIKLPESLSSKVTAVLGLDERPVAHRAGQ